MLEKLRVIEVSEDTIVCFSEKKGRVSLDVEGLLIQFEVADEIVHIEHGFCEVYRGTELIGGINNYYTRLIANNTNCAKSYTNRIFFVTEVLNDIIHCSTNEDKNVSINIEGIVTQINIGDMLKYHEHGMCDIYRDGIMIGGFYNFNSRLNKFSK